MTCYSPPCEKAKKQWGNAITRLQSHHIPKINEWSETAAE